MGEGTEWQLLYAVSVVALAAGGWLMLRMNPLVFFGVHALTRFALDSLAWITYIRSIGPFSILQLYSVAIVGYGLLFLWWRRRLFNGVYLFPIGVLLASYAVGAVLQHGLKGFMEEGLKWIYLFVIINLVLFVIETNPMKRMAWVVIGAVLYPLANQLYSIAIGAPKCDAGQCSYIGTFGHEGDVIFVFMIAVPAVLYLIRQQRGQSVPLWLLAWGFLLYLHFAIYLVNYRTVLAAAAGYWAVYMWMNFGAASLGRRVLLVASVPLAFAAVFAYVGRDMADKFADLSLFLANPGDYLDFSGNAVNDGLLSGRLYLINRYMAAWVNGSVEVLIAGIGIGEGSQRFGVYAHNELISSLTETGLLGMAALCLVVLRMLLSVQGGFRSRLDAAIVTAPMVLAILVSGLGTMPFRDVRAMLCLGLCLGVCEGCRNHANRRRARAAALEADRGRSVLGGHAALLPCGARR